MRFDVSPGQDHVLEFEVTSGPVFVMRSMNQKQTYKRMIASSAKRFLRQKGWFLHSLHVLPFGVDQALDLKRLGFGELQCPLVIDVGANVGLWAEGIRSFFPRSQIVCFEPTPHLSNIIREKFNTRNVKVEELACGASDSIQNLYMFNESMCNSLKKDIEPGYVSSGNIEVRVTTLDSYLKNENINQVDLLKIDAEGLDLDVLRGAKKMIANNSISLILIECMFHKVTLEKSKFLDIYEYLHMYNYKFVTLYTEHVDRDLGFKYGTALFKINRDKEP